MKQTEERHSESRMREIRPSGSMRGSSGAATPPVAPYSTEWIRSVRIGVIGMFRFHPPRLPLLRADFS